MKFLFRTLGAVTAALVLAVPAPALASADDESQADFKALVNGDAGDAKEYRTFHAGESVPVQAGVAYVGATPGRGAVLRLYIAGEMELPTDWTNCQYYGEGRADGAWCEFSDELIPGTAYLLSPMRVLGRPDADRIRYPHKLIFDWYPRSHAEANGGIVGLARNEALQGGRTPSAGTKEPLALRAADLPVPTGPTSPQHSMQIGYYFVPSTATPTVTPPATPTATSTPTTPPSSPAATATSSAPATVPPTTGPVTSSPTPGAPAATEPPVGGEGGGGLPLTGANTALIAGGGLVLLLAGAGGFLVARRRRTKFVA